MDSLLCGLQMYRSLTTTWREDLRKMTMLAGGDPAKVVRGDIRGLDLQ